MEAGKVIVNLLKPQRSIIANIINVATQKGSTDCRLYSIAYCTALAFKAEPSLYVFSQSEMRLHLKSCLEAQCFTQFPVLKTRQLVNICQYNYTISICPIAFTLMMGN